MNINDFLAQKYVLCLFEKKIIVSNDLFGKRVFISPQNNHIQVDDCPLKNRKLQMRCKKKWSPLSLLVPFCTKILSKLWRKTGAQPSLKKNPTENLSAITRNMSKRAWHAEPLNLPRPPSCCAVMIEKCISWKKCYILLLSNCTKRSRKKISKQSVPPMFSRKKIYPPLAFFAYPL